MGPASQAFPFSDIHSTGMVSQDLRPYYTRSLGVNNRKRTRDEESKTGFPPYRDSTTTLALTFKELSSVHSDPIYQKLGLDYAYEPELDYPHDPDPASDAVHALSIGNNCSHSPLPGATGLPSFQYPETIYSDWLTTYSIHFESLPNSAFLSERSSARSSGLLEASIATVYESGTIGSGKKPASEKSSCSSAITDPIETTAVDLCTAEWEEIGDHRSSSLINGYEETMPHAEHPCESSHGVDFSRLDALFDTGWFLRSSQRAEETNDGFLAFLAEDLSEEIECILTPSDVLSPDGMLSAVSLDSCPWNSMPSACQMPER